MVIDLIVIIQTCIIFSYILHVLEYDNAVIDTHSRGVSDILFTLECCRKVTLEELILRDGGNLVLQPRRAACECWSNYKTL